MRALCWYGTEDVRVENVPDPTILNPGDAIVRVTATAICGSDLHLYDGYIPTMQKGDILGHEFMGEVVEVGPEVRRLAVGDRVVVPFTISCGRCWFCRHELYSQCDNSNPNAWLAERFWGHSPAGIYGYSHIVGGYAGGQAEYARVPFADVGPIKVPRGLTDEQALFLSDILPTGWMGAENCDIRPGDVVAVWGCGPVGQFAILSALMLGAERVLAIDRVPERLALAARRPGVETIDQSECDVVDELRYRTGGRGPDACIDAVGLEAHGKGLLGALDKAKQTVRIQSDRPFVLREAIQAVRKGGTVSIPGVYGGLADMIPLGSVVSKALTIKAGQTHVQRYMRPLLERIEAGEIDPTFVITHRGSLEQAPELYRTFRDKEDGCIKVVLKPFDGSPPA